MLIQVKTHVMPWFAIMRALFAPVAQLDRVLVSEAKGRGFDSRRAHQKMSKLTPQRFQPFLFKCQGNESRCLSITQNLLSPTAAHH